MDLECTSYSIGKPFPDEKYISSSDSVKARITPHSFDVVMTLSNITASELKAIVCDNFYISIFVHKQVPSIVFDFKVYKCDFTINIQKINKSMLEQWMSDRESTVVLYLLEEGTGNILNIRFIDFSLMTQLKYLLQLQYMHSKEDIDARFHEAEQLYSVQDMVNYSIFYSEIPESGIQLFNEEDELLL